MPEQATQALQTVEVTGPDGQTYHFPEGTTKDSAIAYFRAKGIGAAPSQPAAGPPKQGEQPPDSVGGGFVRRAIDTAKGAYQTFLAPPSTTGEKVSEALGLPAPVLRTAKGLAATEGELAQQYLHQVKQGDALPAFVTQLSMMNPLAAAPVANVNKLRDQDRMKEAVGGAGFDTLMLLLGGRKAAPAKSGAKLGYALGIGDKVASELLPDLAETAKRTGTKVETVGDIAHPKTGLIQQTLSDYERTFNTNLQKVAGDKLVPTRIADALRAKADALPPTATAEARALHNAATAYETEWTMRDLNAERMYRQSRNKGFHESSPTRQMAAVRSDADTMIDSIVENESRDLLYDEMQHRIPNAGVNFAALKLKQSKLLDVLDDVKRRLDTLDKQQAQSGKPFRAGSDISASVSPTRGSIHPYLHGMKKYIPGMHLEPQAAADVAARGAFKPPSGAGTIMKRSVLSLPVTAIDNQPPDE